MSKDQVNQFDATAGNNTDIEGINTSETMLPSAVNNSIRSLMSLLKKQDVGTHAMTSPDINGGTIDGAAASVTTLNTSDAVIFNDAGADVDFRVEGDADPHLIFADASVDGVVIGGSTGTQFNAVAGAAKLTVIGSSASTNVLGNTGSALQIVNTDQTALNTAGLHFSRADTDENPNFAGASIVAQFGETQTTSQYPSASLSFLTSTAHQHAPSLKMTLTAAGLLGVGVAAPSEKLEVAGNIILDAASAHMNIKSGGGGTSGAVNWTFNTDSTVYGSMSLAYDTRASLGLVTNTSYPISLEATGGSGFIRFRTSTAERMRLTTTGLGIGLTAPTVPLHCVGAQLTTGILSLGSIGATGGTSGELYFGGVSGSVNGFRIHNKSGNALTFANATATLMTIKDNGQTGIGNSAPATKLHISNSASQNSTYGNVQINYTGTDGAANSGLTVKNYGGTGQFMQWEHYGLRIGSRILTNSGVGDVIFTAGADSEKMRITAGGHVGINVAAPTETLTAHGAIRSTSSSANFAAGVAGAFMDMASGIARLGTVTGASALTGDVSFIANNAEKARLLANGNFGIGLTNPSQKLHVAGNIYTTGYLNTAGSGTAGGVQFADGNLYMYRDTNDLAIKFQGAEHLRITAAGHVTVSKYNGSAGSPTESADWPTPVMALRGYGNFTKESMLSFGYSNDATYQTGNTCWNFRLDGTASATASSSATNLELHGPGDLALGSGGVETMRLVGSGCGIGNSAPAYTLHVSGDIYATGNVTAYSSAVAKDNITTIPDALDIVEKLRGVTFDWKDSGNKAVGLIYEEVKEVIPELTSNEKGNPGVAYQNTVALLIEAVKTLSTKVKELETT
jgi:hypothetical protein